MSLSNSYGIGCVSFTFFSINDKLEKIENSDETEVFWNIVTKLKVLQTDPYLNFFELFGKLKIFCSYMLQENPPYNKGAFRIEINFPAEYPFKPPKICFKTKIYHPNIDEKGQVCLPIISAENWKPATKTDQGM